MAFTIIISLTFTVTFRSDTNLEKVSINDVLPLKAVCCDGLVEFCWMTSLQSLAKKQHLWRVGKMTVIFFGVCGPKFMTIATLRSSKAILGRLWRAFFRKYSPLTLEVIEKRPKVLFLAFNFFPESLSQIFGQFIGAIYFLPFGKVWLSSVCEAWQWSRMQDLRRMCKHNRPIFSASVETSLWNVGMA